MGEKSLFDPLGLVEGFDRDLRRIMGVAGGSNPCGPGHNPDGHRPYTCAELTGFRSIRRAVMRRVWDEVREMERQGQVITTRQFGAMVEQEWDRAREAARQCPGSQVALEL